MQNAQKSTKVGSGGSFEQSLSQIGFQDPCLCKSIISKLQMSSKGDFIQAFKAQNLSGFTGCCRFNT